MTIAILGSGPAGLVAAAALDDIAHPEPFDVQIFSLGSPSPLYGAQYLHAPIPGFTHGDPIDVKYRLSGEAEGYRNKVYGYGDVTTSVEVLEEDHEGWDIRQTYAALWEEYSYLITPAVIDWQTVQAMSERYDLVISTIPATKVCRHRDGRHMFRHTQIMAAGSAPDIGILLDEWDSYCDEGEVVCSGRFEDHWYRISRIFGYKTIEFPWSERAWAPKTAGAVMKPIDHTCDCWADTNVHQVGRYGAWKKGVLVHEVFEQVQEIACR